MYWAAMRGRSIYSTLVPVADPNEEGACREPPSPFATTLPSGSRGTSRSSIRTGSLSIWRDARGSRSAAAVIPPTSLSATAATRSAASSRSSWRARFRLPRPSPHDARGRDHGAPDAGPDRVLPRGGAEEPSRRRRGRSSVDLSPDPAAPPGPEAGFGASPLASPSGEGAPGVEERGP